MYHPRAHGHDLARHRGLRVRAFLFRSAGRADRISPGSRRGDGPGPRLPVPLDTARLPARSPQLDALVPRASVSRPRDRPPREGVLADGAPCDPLALRRDRRRDAHPLRLDHELRHDVLDARHADALLARLGVHPRSLVHRDRAREPDPVAGLSGPAAPHRVRRRGPALRVHRLLRLRARPGARDLEADGRAAPPAPRSPCCRSSSRPSGGSASRSAATRSTWPSSTSAPSPAARRTRSPRRSGGRSCRACGTSIRHPSARRSSASRGRPPRRPSQRPAPFPRSASTWHSPAFRSRRSTRRPTAARRSSSRTCASSHGSPGRGSAAARMGIRRQPFVYRVLFDAALRPVERGFVRGGRR